VRIVVTRDDTSTSIEEIDAGHLDVVAESHNGALWGAIDD